jgi:hypothetical protein
MGCPLSTKIDSIPYFFPLFLSLYGSIFAI